MGAESEAHGRLAKLSTAILLCLICGFYALCLAIPKGIGGIGGLLIFLAAIIYCRDFFKQQLIQLPRRFWLQPLVIFSSFGCVAILSLIISGSEYLAWSRLDHPIRFLLIGCLFYLLSGIKINLSMLYWAFVMGAIAAGIGAMMDFFEYRTLAATGAARHRIIFGCVSSMLGIFVLATLPSQKTPKAWVFGGIAFLFSVIATVLSGSRGAWVGLLATLSVLLFITPALKKRSASILIISIAMIGSVWMIESRFGLGLIAERVGIVKDEVVGFAQGGSLVESSVGSRLEMWRAAIIIFLDHPLIGSGPKSFKPESGKLIEQGIISDTLALFPHAHNQYLESMATMGILGLAALLVLWVGPLFLSVRFKRLIEKNKLSAQPGSRDAVIYANICILLCVGYIVFGLSNAMLDRHSGIVFFLVTAAICLSQITFYKKNSL